MILQKYFVNLHTQYGTNVLYKMKNKSNKKIVYSVAVAMLLLAAVIAGSSYYMLNYSLGYPEQSRKTAEVQRERVRKECPWTIGWMDSVYQHHAVKDTFVVMPSGYKAHALYLYAPKKNDKTAVVVHGYKMRAEGMLHIAYLYNHDMGYNVLLPDLYGHGDSEGDHIQMGWNDRWDALRWSQVADEIFSKQADTLHKERQTIRHTRQVLHGISMGAATVMAVSGERTPDYVKCFVEDCGYSSVWDEFAGQLKEQFGLPSFPLMNTTSMLCSLKYGWSFAEAQQIAQVKKSTKPMLFIHGDKDDFVPYRMLQPLYEAKRNGRKAIFIAKGSVHAMAYSDHHEEYTRKVKEFVDGY